MVSFTVTTNKNWDDASFSTRIGNDTYTLSTGARLTIDTDTRYCLNSNISGSFGLITLTSAVSGACELYIDGTNVRLIPFDSGTGVVPAVGTTIIQGAVTSSLLGVWSAFNVPPTAVGASMPSSGSIKVKNVFGSYVSGALTGIGASCTGSDTPGWIEVVGVESATATSALINVGSPNKFTCRGSWFEHPSLVTTGVSGTIYQLPASLANTYYPGIWVEKSTPDTYEFYPSAGGYMATGSYGTSFGTDEVRGKVAWISSSGSVTLGFDTVYTNGYLPPAGRKIRVPNIVTLNSAVGASGSNVIPNGSLTTRVEIATTNAGTIDFDKCNMAWSCNFVTPKAVSITNSGILDQVLINRCHTRIILNNTGLASTWYNYGGAHMLYILYSMFGAEITDVVCCKGSLTASIYQVYVLGSRYMQFTRLRSFNLQLRNATTLYNVVISTTNDVDFTDCVFGVGPNSFASIERLTLTNTTYYDIGAGTTLAAIPIYAIYLSLIRTGVINGLNFGGLTMVQPYTGLITFNGNDCKDVTIKNIGTPSVPLNLGGAKVSDAPWIRVSGSVIASVTSSNHGLKTGDNIATNVCTDAAIITIAGGKAVTYVDPNIFTIACVTGLVASGTLEYWPTTSAYSVLTNAGTTMNHDIVIQQCYFEHARTGAYPVTAGDIWNMRCDNVWGDAHTTLGPALLPQTNSTNRGARGKPALTAQVGTYGTHWIDYHNSNLPTSLSGTWSRVAAVATLTSSNHNFVTNDYVIIESSSAPTALLPGMRAGGATNVALDSSRFNIPCTAAGPTSGTFTMTPAASWLTLLFNEPSNETTGSQCYVLGSPRWSGAGTLTLANIGDAVVHEMPDYSIGYTGFNDYVPISLVTTVLTSPNADMFYQIDKNDGTGFSAWKNLHYNRATGTGTSGKTALTCSSTTGIAVGDSITGGANIPYRTKVVSIDSPTTLTTNLANLGTVSSALIFRQLPQEVIDPVKGFKLRVKTIALAAGQVLTYIIISMQTTEASRALQYPSSGVVTKSTLWNPSIGDVINYTPSGSSTAYKGNITNARFPVADPVSASMSRYEYYVKYDISPDGIASASPWRETWTTVSGYVPVYSALTPVVTGSNSASGSITRYVP